jgi:hypothetical protein
MKSKITTFLYALKLVLIPMIAFNIVWYLVGSLIALDFNITHWWLFNSVLGRIIFVILEYIFLTLTPDFWEIFE